MDMYVYICIINKQHYDMKILNKTTGAVLFEIEDVDSMKKLVEIAVLKGVKLIDADLSRSDLRGLDIGGTLERGAYLTGATFKGSDLRDANLNYARAMDADFTGAELCRASFKSATLVGANFYGSTLYDANFRDADLSHSNFRASVGASTTIFTYALILHPECAPYIPLACPEEGSFIGWKKVGDCIVKLLIPEDAKRCSGTSNKCRCDKARVLEIRSLAYSKGGYRERIVSNSYATCVYRVGRMVYPDSYDEDRWNECSHGIHFFINRQDAVNY